MIRNGNFVHLRPEAAGTQDGAEEEHDGTAAGGEERTYGENQSAAA